MTDENSMDRDDREPSIHQVSLQGQPVGRNRGTVLGPLPLWFMHEGITYIRDPSTSHASDEAPIADYRPVPRERGSSL